VERQPKPRRDNSVIRPDTHRLRLGTLATMLRICPLSWPNRLGAAWTCLLLCLAACQTTPSGVAPNAVIVTASDADTRVHVAPGQEVLVRLLANPATGYEWQLLAMPDQSVLLPDGNRWVQSSAEIQRQDEVKNQELRFVAQGPGETRVQLEYLVPGRPGGAGDAQFGFTVVVKSP
jgi:predicted secreted protein